MGSPSARSNTKNCVVTSTRTGAKATVRFLSNTTNTYQKASGKKRKKQKSECVKERSVALTHPPRQLYDDPRAHSDERHRDCTEEQGNNNHVQVLVAISAVPRPAEYLIVCLYGAVAVGVKFALEWCNNRRH